MRTKTVALPMRPRRLRAWIVLLLAAALAGCSGPPPGPPAPAEMRIAPSDASTLGNWEIVHGVNHPSVNLYARAVPAWAAAARNLTIQMVLWNQGAVPVNITSGCGAAPWTIAVRDAGNATVAATRPGQNCKEVTLRGGERTSAQVLWNVTTPPGAYNATVLATVADEPLEIRLPLRVMPADWDGRPPVDLSIRADHAEFTPGENVSFTVRLTNQGPMPLRFRGCDITLPVGVFVEGDRVLMYEYAAADGARRFCELAGSTVQPGDTATRLVQWNGYRQEHGGDGLPHDRNVTKAGTYRIFAIFKSDDFPTVAEANVTIRVLPRLG